MRAAERLDERRVAELARRDVERDRDAQALGLPRGRLAAALLDHPAPERLDQARVLGGGDELQRRRPGRARVLPAQRAPRRPATRAVVLEVEHRLVVQDELLALDRAAQPRGDEQPLERVRGAALVERDAHALGAARLAHRRLGVAQQALGSAASPGKTLAPTRARSSNALALDLERPARRDDDLPGGGLGDLLGGALDVGEHHRELAVADVRRRAPCRASAWRRRSATSRSDRVARAAAEARGDEVEPVEADVEQHDAWSSLRARARSRGAGARAGAGGREAR